MRSSRVLATGFAAFCLAALVLNIVLQPVGAFPEKLSDGLPLLALTILATPVAVLLIWHLPRHALSVLLAIYVGSQFASLALTTVALTVAPSGPVADEVVGRVENALWAGSLPLLAPMITAFPDGAPQGRMRRLFEAQVTAVAVLGGVALVDNPADGLHPVSLAASIACGVLLVATAAVATGRLAVRARRERRVRGELGGFAVAALFVVGPYVVVAPLSLVLPGVRSAESPLAYAALIAALPAAIGYAVVRHRLFGITVVLTRVLVAGTASAVLAVAYVAAVLAVAAALGSEPVAPSTLLIPAAIVAVVLLPGYRWLQDLIGRAVYGRRDDPLNVLHTLGDHLARTAPEDVPDRIVRVLRDSLKLSWVALDIEQDGTFTRAAHVGEALPEASAEVFHLSYAGAVPGRLVVRPRRGERTLGRLDRSVIRHVAEQAGSAVAAARYVGELTLSRERLVLGREEERARLRHALHDGLSPALAGISLALNAARRLLRSDPVAADDLLRSAESEASVSWGNVRRILDDLRPQTLEELGLVGAIEQRGRSLTRPGEFAVTVVAEPLPPMPAEVETAAYRIAVEAMSNSARHARAGRCWVALSADESLHLTVEDNGSGLPPTRPAGVGIQSMHARAAEVGGRLDLGPLERGGTRVMALLPLAPP